MFSEIDNIIFPDSCEVIEVVPSQHYVYPIFKNASSSLRHTQNLKQWPSIYDQDIGKIDNPITVYLRDPKQRFISGINTFVQHCQRDYPELDKNTILHFAKNYLWLNRHFCPQFFWLVNLSRFSSSPMILCDLEKVNQIVDVDYVAAVDPPNKELFVHLKSFPWDKIQLYLFLDQILIELIGKTMTFDQIMQHIKTNHKNIYNTVFQKTFDILNVLSKT